MEKNKIKRYNPEVKAKKMQQPKIRFKRTKR